MRLLIIGGTGLTGTAIVQAALDAGHEVTAVHRGSAASSRGSGVPDGATSLILDRTDGHEPLASDDWDAVIDVSGYLPAIVRDAARHLDRADRPYVYVSTVSVYDAPDTPMLDESGPLLEITDAAQREAALTDPRFDWRAAGLYGHCKVLCERELQAAVSGPLAILRPVVITGAYDHTWRAAYWVDRGMRGAPFIAPTPREQPVALIDVRDLAAFAVHCAEERRAGTFNLSPDPALTNLGTLVDAAVAAGERGAEATRIAGDDLEAAGVAPWAGLPLWLPESTGSSGMSSFDTAAARAAGYIDRPIAETVASVRDWLASADPAQLPDPGATLTVERERELLTQLR